MTLSHVSMEARSSPRNWKSSSLLSSFRKTFFQFPGSLAWLDTRLRVPVPLFALVASFRLSFMYTSQTSSTCLVFRETDIRKCFKHEIQKYHPALSSVKLKQGGQILLDSSRLRRIQLSREYPACGSNSPGWCCASFSKRGIENLCRI